MRKPHPRVRVALGVAAIWLGACAHQACDAGQVDASTLYGKRIMGYQGWFGCPGDGSGRGWVHWMNARHEPTVDLLPDVSELDAEELCDSGWKDAEGKPIMLFSSQNRKTVDRHFKWMEDYDLDGVALQRFGTELTDPILKNSLDKVLANVRAGAARHGRVWFVMYDLSGLPPAKYPLIVSDWKKLSDSGVTRDAGYQRHKGKAVLGLWGIGFAERPMKPEDANRLLLDLRAASGGELTIVGGVPTHWREGKGDASADPGWKSIWPEIDVVSPWTVGRYKDADGADNYAKEFLAPDFALTQAMGIDLMPVVFPGFSWANLMRATGQPAKAILDQIPRRCGALYRRQISNLVTLGTRMAYTAMFDEVDEGTAIFKLSPSVLENTGERKFVSTFNCLPKSGITQPLPPMYWNYLRLN